MSAQSGIGPDLPPRQQVYALANELEQLARRAREFASPGPRVSLPLAVKQLDRARALLAKSTDE